VRFDVLIDEVTSTLDRLLFVGQGRLCRTIPLFICFTSTVLALAPSCPTNYLKVATLTFKTRLHHQPTYYLIYTICFIITHQPVHCDHLPPTCYRKQQQLPRHLTGHLSSLLLKPGITYQKLFDLQHHFILSLAISKRTSS